MFPNSLRHHHHRHTRRPPRPHWTVHNVQPVPSMVRRPPSSAGSSRPVTSTGRPPYAHGSALFHNYPPQYPFNPDCGLEEEEEESDDDDVFAFLPPSTAEQREHLHQDVAQSTEHYQGDATLTNHIASSHITYPSPTFNPDARYPADSVPVAGPSAPIFRYFQPPPQSPPSTDSQTNNTPDGQYRLSRLSTAPDTILSHVPTTAESREVRVSLPHARRSEKDPDVEIGSSTKRRINSSILDSSSMDPSVLDDETSHGGSIK